MSQSAVQGAVGTLSADGDGSQPPPQRPSVPRHKANTSGSRATMSKIDIRVQRLRAENKKLAKDLQRKDEFIHFLRVEVGLDLLKLEELQRTLKCPLCAEEVSAPHRLDHCGHVFCCTCLVRFFDEDEKEYDIIGLHQCPARLCTGVIQSPPVRDIATEVLISKVQLAEGKEVINTPSTPPNFFDKYFFLDAYLESCGKLPPPSQ